MKPVKRIELVINTVDIEEVLTAFERIGIKQYSRIREVWGKGNKWSDGSDGFLSEAFYHEYILAVCDPEKSKTLADQLSPLLHRTGGLFLESDAISYV
jgi:nitrogen regulatory protein PII